MADNGDAVLAAHIRRLRELAKLPAKVAPKIAVALEAEILGNVARGVGPAGERWPRTESGHLPLQGAGSVLEVRAEGLKIRARLEGHYARHHLGWARGGVQRAILPTKAIPDPMVRAIRRVVEEEFEQTMEAR